jgi:hypothetical protein
MLLPLFSLGSVLLTESAECGYMYTYKHISYTACMLTESAECGYMYTYQAYIIHSMHAYVAYVYAYVAYIRMLHI